MLALVVNPAPAAGEEPTEGDVIAGKYRVEFVLGKGGMGRVLAARHIQTGKRVALKWVLDPESGDARERFAREARAAGRIHHANVVVVYDVVEHDEAMCLVMERLSGESLASCLTREKQLPAELAVPIGIQIARGLAAAHDEGVIHRDLKPANLFLTDGEGETGLKILDFGISKILDGDSGAPVTKSGAVLGTPHYMAPEQVLGMGGSDPRLDVYSLGAVLYEMLSGRPPHHHEKLTALLVQIATEPTTPIDTLVPELDGRLAAVIMKCLAKNPADRFLTARDVGLALEVFGEGMLFETPKRRARMASGQSAELASGENSGASGELSTQSPTVLATPPLAASAPDSGTPVESGELPTVRRTTPSGGVNTEPSLAEASQGASQEASADARRSGVPWPAVIAAVVLTALGVGFLLRPGPPPPPSPTLATPVLPASAGRSEATEVTRPATEPAAPPMEVATEEASAPSDEPVPSTTPPSLAAHAERRRAPREESPSEAERAAPAEPEPVSEPEIETETEEAESAPAASNAASGELELTTEPPRAGRISLDDF